TGLPFSCPRRAPASLSRFWLSECAQSYRAPLAAQLNCFAVSGRASRSMLYGSKCTRLCPFGSLRSLALLAQQQPRDDGSCVALERHLRAHCVCAKCRVRDRIQLNRRMVRGDQAERVSRLANPEHKIGTQLIAAHEVSGVAVRGID